MADLPSFPHSGLPRFSDLGPDPEPLGLRAERLIARSTVQRTRERRARTPQRRGRTRHARGGR